MIADSELYLLPTMTTTRAPATMLYSSRVDGRYRPNRKLTGSERIFLMFLRLCCIEDSDEGAVTPVSY